MNVRYYIDRPRADGKSYIMLSLTYHSRQVRVSTGETIEPALWDQAGQRVRKSAAGARQINDWLLQCSEQIAAIYREMRNGINPVPDPEQLQKRFREWLVPPAPEPAGPSLEDRWQQWIEETTPLRAPETIKHYTSSLNTLKKFRDETGGRLEFDNMNQRFYDDLLKHLFGKELLNESVSKIVKNLKAFLTYAADRGWCDPVDTRKWKLLEGTADTVALTVDELEAIEQLDLSDNERLAHVRDLFLVQCYTGLRYSDLKLIAAGSVRRKALQITVSKTREPIKIPLIPAAAEILRRYPEGLRVISNQKMNSYLRELVQKAGVTEPMLRVRYSGPKRIEETFEKWQLVTTHTGRRTFATVSLLRGMNRDMVKKLTGHKTEKAFGKYVRITEKQVEEEMHRAWVSPDK